MSFGMADVFIEKQNKPTDNEIIKALNVATGLEHISVYCADSKGENVQSIKMTDIVDLINRQQAENENLEYKLLGVMHFVDKWLDGAELEQDEVSRASAMREKTLQIVEKHQSELQVYKKALSKSSCVFNPIGDALVFTTTQEEYVKTIKHIQDAAIKEFAQTLRKEIDEALENNHTIKTKRIDKLIERGIRSNDDFCHIVDGKILALRGIDVFIENLVKERTGAKGD